MAIRYVRPTRRTPSRRTRITFRARSPPGRRQTVSFLRPKTRRR